MWSNGHRAGPVRPGIAAPLPRRPRAAGHQRRAHRGQVGSAARATWTASRSSRHRRAAAATRGRALRRRDRSHATAIRVDESIRPAPPSRPWPALKPAFEDPGWPRASPRSTGASPPATRARSTTAPPPCSSPARPRSPRARPRAHGPPARVRRRRRRPAPDAHRSHPGHREGAQRAGLGIGDIDLFEVNEAFAPVVLAWQRETGADLDKVNVTAARSPSATRSAPAARGSRRRWSTRWRRTAPATGCRPCARPAAWPMRWCWKPSRCTGPGRYRGSREGVVHHRSQQRLRASDRRRGPRESRDTRGRRTRLSDEQLRPPRR